MHCEFTFWKFFAACLVSSVPEEDVRTASDSRNVSNLLEVCYTNIYTSRVVHVTREGYFFGVLSKTFATHRNSALESLTAQPSRIVVRISWRKINQNRRRVPLHLNDKYLPDAQNTVLHTWRTMKPIFLVRFLWVFESLWLACLAERTCHTRLIKSRIALDGEQGTRCSRQQQKVL